jgi:hypothetical protein
MFPTGCEVLLTAAIPLSYFPKLRVTGSTPVSRSISSSIDDGPPVDEAGAEIRPRAPGGISVFDWMDAPR